jgi:hypothetical protein
MIDRPSCRALWMSATGAALVVLVAGCGSPSSPSSSGSTSAAEATDRPVLTSSPLDGYLPLTDGMSEEAREVTRVAQGLIAQCLKDQGFDYDEPYLSDQAIREGEGLSATEWAAAYGFGYATSTGAEAAAPEADQRSPAEQQAYFEALYGPEPTDLGEDDVPVYDWTTQGCLGSAYHEATGGIDVLYGDEAHALILGEIDALAQIVEESTEVQTVDAAWADCMADGGYGDLSRPSDAAELALGWWQGVAEAESAETAGESGSEPSGEEPQDPAAREIALAVADVECQLSVDHAATVQQVRWQHEQVLVETYPSELAALRDATASLS